MSDSDDESDAINNAVAVYRDYSRIPTVSNVSINNFETPGHICINSEWSLRDIESSTNVKFLRHHIAQLNDVFPTIPIDISTEVFRKDSPSGKYCAILRKIKDKKSEEKQFIEIWDETNKIQNIDMSDLERHGKVYEDDQFGTFAWSNSETHMLYVAEKKQPKAKSYFPNAASMAPFKEESDNTGKGEEFVYRNDWGEQLSGKTSSVICCLDILAGFTMTLDNLPDDVFPGQAMWCKDDEGFVCVGWYPDPYKLGIIYCPMRRSSIFYVDVKKSTCTILGSVDHSVRSPRFSPDFTKLVWLQNPAAGPHQQCSQLIMCDWSNKGIVTVLDIVRKPTVTDFQGVFVHSLPKRCWSRDNQRLIFSTASRGMIKGVVVDTVTGTVTTLPTNGPCSISGCFVVKDVHNDLVVAACSTPNQPQYLVVGQLPSAGKESSALWTLLSTEPPRFLDFTWRLLDIEPPADQINSKYGSLDFGAILLEPTQQDANKKPRLIVYPHGGPHTMFPADFMLYPAALCKLGYAVLLVNYRGSIGYGQDNIDSLLGNVGTQDVKDCQHAMQTVLDMEVADPNNVYVMGGSHGGFLAVHLIGQYPGFFKAACCRNPVINMATMLGGSDIPDWAYTECGLVFDHTQTGHAAVYDELWKRSPIRYVDQMNTPTLIMIGTADRRVPPQQGHELWKALSARKVPIRLLKYTDNDHRIANVDAEADAFINIYKWFWNH